MKRSADTRMQRIKKIQQRLLQRPKGLTAGELARALEVSKPTILRDLAMLEYYLGTKLEPGESYRYILNSRKLLHALMLSTDELLAVYFAVRLLSRHSDEHNPYVVTALEKLAEVLQMSSPIIAHHIEQAAAAVRSRNTRPEYIHSLQVLTQGWAEGRAVHFHYRSYDKDEETERTFGTYFIEPNGIGYACYAIGFDYLRKDIRTFKVERMFAATVTDEKYDLPSDFDVQRMLASAWNVIWRDAENVTVVLHFAPSVVRRVKESTWHHSQEIKDLPDGSCIYTVRIGSTKEVLPWVRGWGSDVEILEPPEFRAVVVTDVQKMMHMYELCGNTSPQ